MTRRIFFRRTGAVSALLTCARPGRADETKGLEWKGGELGNASFRLSLSPADGLKNTRLTHAPSGLLLADGDYSYSFGRPTFRESRSSQAPDGSSLISLRGSALAGHLEVLHEFRVPPHLPWIEEQVTLTNRGVSPLELEFGRCGFVLPLPLSNGQVSGPWAQFKFTAIPYRREPNGHRTQYADFTPTQLLNQQFSSQLWTYETSVTPGYASEGWAWTDGQQGFLVTKYSEKGMEWSLLDSLPLEDGRSGLRWGGYGIHHGDPEHGAWLAPGESHRFGVTRLTAYDGSRSEEHTSELQSLAYLVCRLLLEKKKNNTISPTLLHYNRNLAERLLQAHVLNGYQPVVKARFNRTQFRSAHLRRATYEQRCHPSR